MAQLNASESGVGVVLCDCSGELQQRLDFSRLEERLGALSSVLSVAVCSDLCAATSCSEVLRAASEAGAERLVVGACSTDKIEPSLGRRLAQAGFNDGLWWPVNIREQCALATDDATAATEKALERLTAAVNRVQSARPVTAEIRSVCGDVVVVGGGVAGLQAAVTLSRLGHSVSIVHKGDALGGMAGAVPELYGYVAADAVGAAEQVSARVGELVREVEQSDAIGVYTDACLCSAAGELGSFSVNVRVNGADRQALQAGAIVLATGGAFAPACAGLNTGVSPRIVGVTDAVAMIRSGSVPQRVAVVMDVTGEQGRAVSAQALSVAELMTTGSGTRVKVYCHSVRVAAPGLEGLYRRARAAGAMVVKYDNAPAVSVEGDGVTVVSNDPIAGVDIGEQFDLVVVADVLDPDSTEVAAVLGGLRTGPQGALQHDDVWLLPALSNRPGVFVVGGARGNSEYRDALTDGLAVAHEVHALLGDGEIEARDDAATVDGEKCVLCLTCLRICPHSAIHIDTDAEAASVSQISCQRCGVCAAECPAQAITLPRYTDEEMAADIGEAPRVIVFACENSAIPAAEAAAGAAGAPAGDVRLVRVPCAGKVDPRSVLSALEKGASRVLILGCHPDSCQYLDGSSRAAKRVERMAALLEKAGVDRSRVSFGGIASVEPARFVEYVS